MKWNQQQGLNAMAASQSALIGCFLLIGCASASAGSVTIERATPNPTIVVTADGATLDEILNTLAERTAFDLERVGEITLARTVTHTYNGTTRQILDQVLNNENYVIVTSSPAGNISRVVLYGHQSRASQAPTNAAPAVAPKAPAAPVAASSSPVAVPPAVAPAAVPARPPLRQASTQHRRTIALPTSLTTPPTRN
jgi:hypothetical protein